jgi:biopolymer transport protein ExbD
MTFAPHDASLDADTPVMNEINMTPLVDVMLVLLIIFIITVPVMKQAIHVNLPSVSSQPLQPKPETLLLSVDAQGGFFLNQRPLDAAQLAGALQAEAGKQPQPDLQLRGDKAVRYEFVAEAMAVAKQAGLHKIAFVTEPRR